MKGEAPRIHLIRVAKLHRRKAEMLAELAEIERMISVEYGVLGDEDASASTGRRRHTAPAPELPPISELDRQRARKELRANEIRRRVGR